MHHPFDLRELIQDIHALFGPKAQGKALWFDLLDRLGENHLVVGDALRIRQILSNFLGNAIKFTEQGGLSLLAVVEPGPANSAKARFEIKDTGVGIEQTALDRVFAPFEQADRLTWSKFGGTGLGLAICKKLARLMGGDVGVESVPGRGSTFWLEINLDLQCAKVPSLETAGSSPVAVKSSPVPPSSCNVLVAEDDPDMAMLMDDMLKEAGHKVTIANDGAGVLKALEDRAFDVILMDGRMPDMSGFETTDHIRRLPDERANIPIIALTAEAMTGDRERFLSAGMDDYVSKPVSYDLLLRAIDRCRFKTAYEQAETASG